MTKRKSLTLRDRVELFWAREGKCDRCEIKLMHRKYEIDHRIALCNGGSNDHANLRLLCLACHKSKTRKDVKAAAKGVRIQAQHIGAKRSRNPLPFGRRSPFKKKLTGEIVRR